MTSYKLFRTQLAVLLAMAVLAQLFITTSRAGVLYTETFSTATYVTYSSYSTTAGYASPWTVYDNTYHQDMSNNASYTTDGGNDSVGIVGASDKHSGTGIAALYNASAINGDIFNAFRSGLSIVNPGTLTFEAMRKTSSNTATLQLMVQVGTQWYVSSYAITPTGVGSGSGAFSGSASYESFDFTTNTSWYTYTPTYSTSMTANLSSSTTTLNMSQQTLTGIGWYATVGTAQALYFDTMTINSVPEPRTWALLGAAACVLFCRIRRHRIV